jgi:hypothetical protein
MSDPREWEIRSESMECQVYGPTTDGHPIPVIEKTPHVEKCIGMHDEMVAMVRSLLDEYQTTLPVNGEDNPDYLEDMALQLLTKAGAK